MLPYDDEGPLAYGRRGALGGQNDGRHPAKPARSCGSMPHRGIDCCATPQCKHQPLQHTVQHANLYTKQKRCSALALHLCLVLVYPLTLPNATPRTIYFERSR